MIHEQFQSFVQEVFSGHGFKKKYRAICHSGPHYMFDKLGEMTVEYYPGKKVWRVTVFSMGKAIGGQLEPSWDAAVDYARLLVNAYYASRLNPQTPLEVTPPEEPPHVVN